MVSFYLKVHARKIWPLLEQCSQKLDQEIVLACSCSLNFYIAGMLRFSLKFPAVQREHNFHLGNLKTDTGNNASRWANWETLPGKHARRAP